MQGEGTVVAGRYRLERLLGAGGMGAVWRATHVDLGRPVALKRVHGDAPSAVAVERFLREARSAASVRHRNVVDVLDVGRDEAGQPYLVMECLDGESLADRLARVPAPTLRDLAAWMAGALAGLAAIHDAGIVHRDLKPANLFLAREADGVVVKVLDFGIARPSEPAGALTGSMQTLGTPHYMSPEQVRSAHGVDARSDLYAVGIILYQALAGRLPFDGPSLTAVIASIVMDEPASLATLRPDLPPALVEVVHRAMARAPDARFESARALAAALATALDGVDGEARVSPRVEVGSDGVPRTAAAKSGPGEARAPTDPSWVHAKTAYAPSGPPLPGPALSERAVSPSTTARTRTSRRGFFAMLGVFSTLLAGGLAVRGVMLGGADMASVSPSAPAAARMDEGAAPSAPPAEASPLGAPSATEPTLPAQPPVEGSPDTPSPSLGGAEPSALSDEAAAARFAAEPRELARLAVALRELDPATRGQLHLVPDAGAFRAVGVTSALDALEARVPGGGLGVRTASSSLVGALEPTLVVTRERANLRVEPSESALPRLTLPRGTVLVALHGDVAGARSEPDAAGAFTYVIAAEGFSGWVASGLLAPDRGCVPAAAALGGADVLFARARARSAGGRDEDVFVTISWRGRGTLAVSRVDAACRLELLARWTVRAADAVVTRVAPDGEALVAYASAAGGTAAPVDGTQRWAAVRLSASSVPVWSRVLRTGPNVPSAERDQVSGPGDDPGGARPFAPLRVRERSVWRDLVWDGSALVDP